MDEVRDKLIILLREQGFDYPVIHLLVNNIILSYVGRGISDAEVIKDELSRVGEALISINC